MMDDTAKTYKYDAFISYNHIDQKAAVAVQHKLERYWIPKAIRKTRKDRPVHLKVFLDETDLSAGNLEKNIYEALDQSAKLIVICSSAQAPNGADKYKWVTLEVQHFIDAGRGNDILPMVVDGGWDALPLNLKAMSDRQFISDISSLGKRKAFLKVLSAVLETDFDELVKRANVRRNVYAAALLTSVLLSAVVINYYYMPHTTYYADYIMRNGIPEGVQKLSAAERSVKSDIFAITIRRNRHEICLKHTNSAGLPVEEKTWQNHVESPVIAVYNCLDDWTIDTVDYLDENGKQICTYAYAPDLSYVDLIKSKDDASWLTTIAGTNEYDLPVRTNISRYNLEFNSDGFLSRCMYAVDRLSAVNEEGVGGEAYTYFPSGQLKRINYLDVDGTLIADKHGVAGINFYYDSNGLNYRKEYFGKDEALIENELWYAAMEKSFDSNLNVSEIHYYDVYNNPVITANGYAVEQFDYSQEGFLTSAAYFDEKNNKMFYSNQYHEISIERDRLGRDIGISYLDTDGSLTLISAGYAKRITKYNDDGLVCQQLYFGTDGEPCACGIGAGRTDCEYDENGNMIMISHYDVDDQPVYTTLGYATMIIEYNDMGMERTQSYFGVRGEPILGKEGYHKREFVYDSRYNIEQIQYTGILNQPALCKSGYASCILRYDNAGNILEDSYFDDYGEPTYRTGYYSRSVMRYNERGSRISIEYYNPDGTYADNIWYSKKEMKYDEVGRIEEEYYYKEDNLLSHNTYQYAMGGVVSSKTEDDGNGELTNRTLYVYDLRGNELEVIKSVGDAVTGRTVREFDERGHVVQESYYDSEGCRERYYTVDFNRNGMPVKTCYYDGEGQLSRDANPTEHVAVVEADYNSRNQKIERRCYDENGNPLRIKQSGKETYASLRVNYEKNRTETIYYDDKKTIYQTVVQEYDDYSRETNRIYYDGDHRQLIRHEVQYNERGRVLSDALYDSEDEPFAAASSGVAKIQYFYDDYDYMIGEEFYDAEYKLIAPYGLYPKYLATRENGRTVRIDYYGLDGQLAANPDGYATETFTYDVRGNETGRAFYDADGNPVLLKWKFSRYEICYDETGNIASTKFFDTEDREVKQVDGKLTKAEAVIGGVPQKIIMFYGDDGSSLMGQIEMKIKVPLTQW